MNDLALSKQSKEVRDRGVFCLILVLYLLVASHGLFDRYPIFHDEIINTFKAREFIIFDYAVRPFYYGMNTVALYQFGFDTRALILLGMLFYVGTGICLYYVGLTVGGFVGSLFAPLFFLCFHESFTVGVRAMPHGPAGFFLTLTILAVCRLFTAGRSKQEVALASAFVAVAAMLALGTHVTNLGFLFALGGILTVSPMGILLLRRSVKGMTSSEKDFCSRAILCGIALIVSLVFYSILYKIFYGSNFISVLFGGIRKISDTSSYGTYHKPYVFYFEYLWANYWHLLLMGVFPLLALGLRRRKKSENRSAVQKYLVAWCGFGLLLVFTLAMLSASSWKFVRVLSGFTPLVACFLGLSLSAANVILSVHRASARWLLIIVVIPLVVSAMTIGETMHSLRDKRSKLFHNYYAVHPALMLLPAQRVLFVGPRDYSFYSVGRYATNAGKTLLQWYSAKEILSDRAGVKRLVQRMRAEKVRSLFLSKTAEKLSTEEVAEFNTKMRRNGADLVYSWRGIADIWRLHD